MDINGKKIIVTGAASGIGYQLVTLLSAYNNVSIIAADIVLPTFAQHNVTNTQADLSTEAGVNNLLTQAHNSLGIIDIFFANAGFAYYEKIETASWQRTQNIFAVNTFAPLYGFFKLQQMYPKHPFFYMVTASAMSHQAMPGYSWYVATKFALRGFMQAYNFEHTHPSMLSFVYPVATKSNFFNAPAHSTPIPIPWPTQTPLQVAKAMIKGVQANKKNIYPSLLFTINQILGKFLPIAFFYGKYYQRKFNAWHQSQMGKK